MREITEAAPAKINLYLHVLGRRGDGYHRLESLVVFSALGDQVTVRPAAAFQINVEGPFAAALSGDTNIVEQAAMMFAEQTDFDLKVEISLQKNLPVGAGIGGGSADAAAALRALSRYTDVELDHRILQKIALRLGADVPVCLKSEAAMMRGIGEEVSALKVFPGCGIVLLNPRRGLSTPAIFKKFNARKPTYKNGLNQSAFEVGSFAELVAVLQKTDNDLTTAAIAEMGVIEDLLAALNDAPFARMSGSGGTCFALFQTPEEAKAAASALAATQPNWWVAASVIAPQPVGI